MCSEDTKLIKRSTGLRLNIWKLRKTLFEWIITNSHCQSSQLFSLPSFPFFIPLPPLPGGLCAHSDANHNFVDLAYKTNAIVVTLKCIYLSIISV